MSWKFISEHNGHYLFSDRVYLMKNIILHNSQIHTHTHIHTCTSILAENHFDKESMSLFYVWVASVVSDSAWPHRRQPTRLPCPWDSPGKNTGVGCHFILQCMQVKSESEVAQSCLTLGDPMDCSPPGSSIHGIFQARVLDWGAIAFSYVWVDSWNNACIDVREKVFG